MRSTGMRMGGLVLALLVGVLLAGCGGGDSPEDVLSGFYAALGDGDAGAYCDLLDEASAQAAAEDKGVDTCEEAAEMTFSSTNAAALIAQSEAIEVGESTIDGDTATVAVTTADGEDLDVPLVEEDGEWKVDLGN